MALQVKSLLVCLDPRGLKGSVSFVGVGVGDLVKNGRERQLEFVISSAPV